MAIKDRTFPNIIYRLINSACLFLVTLLLSRIAGAENFGILSLFILNATFLNLFTSFGSDSSITFHIAKLSVRVGPIITYILGILLLQLIFASVIWLVSDITGNKEFLTGSLEGGYAWLLLLLISISIIEKYTALLNGSHYYTLFSKATLVSNLLFIGALMFFLLAGSRLDAKNIITVYVVYSLVQAVFLVVLFHNKVKDGLPPSKLTKNALRKLLGYSLIAYTGNIFQFLAYRMDLWFLQAYWEENHVGLYALAARFAQLLWLVPLVYAGLLFPRVSREEGPVRHAGISVAIRLINVFNLVAIILASIFVYWLLPLFSGEEYRESTEPFLVLLPGIFFFSITLVLASYFAGINKLQINLVGSVACFIIVLVLDLLLIPVYGINGAALASSIGYTVVTFYCIVQYIKYSGESVRDLFMVRSSDMSVLFDSAQRFFSRRA